VVEESDGLKLRVVRSVATAAAAELADMAGMVKAPADRVPPRGVPRRLEDFDPALVRSLSRVLRALAGIPHVCLEDRDAVLAAIDALDKGPDLADALHVRRNSRACASMLVWTCALRPRARAAFHGAGEPPLGHRLEFASSVRLVDQDGTDRTPRRAPATTRCLMLRRRSRIP
jgi:hypothetical protein